MRVGGFEIDVGVEAVTRDGDGEVQEVEGGIRDGPSEFVVGVKVDELFMLLMGARGSADTVINVAKEEMRDGAGYVEQSFFCCYTGTIPHHFFCYIDDCIGAASYSHEELEKFINFTNIFHPNLKFIWTISDTSLPSWTSLSPSLSRESIKVNIWYKGLGLKRQLSCSSDAAWPAVLIQLY
eukprot:g29880.t1